MNQKSENQMNQNQPKLTKIVSQMNQMNPVNQNEPKLTK